MNNKFYTRLFGLLLAAGSAVTPIDAVPFSVMKRQATAMMYRGMRNTINFLCLPGKYPLQKLPSKVYFPTLLILSHAPPAPLFFMEHGINKRAIKLFFAVPSLKELFTPPPLSIATLKECVFMCSVAYLTLCACLKISEKMGWIVDTRGEAARIEEDPEAKEQAAFEDLWCMIGRGDEQSFREKLNGDYAAIKDRLVTLDHEQTTLLHYAARWDTQGEMVKMLVDAGSLLEAQDATGSTPLLVAVQAGNVKAVDYLSKKDGFTLCDNEGCNALHRAVVAIDRSPMRERAKREQIVDLLLQNGFDPSVKVSNVAAKPLCKYECV